MTTTAKTPLQAVLQGLAAGALGNAVYTAFQSLVARLQAGGEPQPPAPRDWAEAPEPAQVGQRVIEGVFQRDVPIERAGLLTNAMHWAYGTGWGALYGLLEESIEQPLVSGVALSTAVVGADYTMLPAMGLYRPPWRYPARTLAKDYGIHLVYGLSVAGAYTALERLRR
jgi:hypothetical protein